MLRFSGTMGIQCFDCFEVLGPNQLWANKPLAHGQFRLHCSGHLAYSLGDKQPRLPPVALSAQVQRHSDTGVFRASQDGEIEHATMVSLQCQLGQVRRSVGLAADRFSRSSRGQSTSRTMRLIAIRSLNSTIVAKQTTAASVFNRPCSAALRVPTRGYSPSRLAEDTFLSC